MATPPECLWFWRPLGGGVRTCVHVSVVNNIPDYPPGEDRLPDHIRLRAESCPQTPVKPAPSKEEARQTHVHDPLDK